MWLTATAISWASPSWAPSQKRTRRKRCKSSSIRRLPPIRAESGISNRRSQWARRRVSRQAFFSRRTDAGRRRRRLAVLPLCRLRCGRLRHYVQPVARHRLRCRLRAAARDAPAAVRRRDAGPLKARSKPISLERRKHHDSERIAASACCGVGAERLHSQSKAYAAGKGSTGYGNSRTEPTTQILLQLSRSSNRQKE